MNIQALKDSLTSNIPNLFFNYNNINDTSGISTSVMCAEDGDGRGVGEETDTNADDGHLLTPTSSTISGSFIGGGTFGDEDDSSEKSQAIPNSLIKEEWQLILGQDATIDELESAINCCKDFVMNSAECSYERKWLVRHLVELRFRLNELQDLADDPNSIPTHTKVILGHHFETRILRNIPTKRQYCDHCSGIIWSVVQASYICSDCSFCVHHKCIQHIIRVCAHVIASEKKTPIEDICPEDGLAQQTYKCYECRSVLQFNTTSPGFYCFGKQYITEGIWPEPRICDYTGKYYCTTCHWNDTAIIPARIIHNWDFIPRKVARASLQELTLFHDRPAINLEEKNAKLFIYVQNLSLVKKLRENLNYMRKYLMECREAIQLKLLESHIGTKRYLIQSSAMFSIADLLSIQSGTIIDYLHKLYYIFDKHIRSCTICSGKAYLCEICSNIEAIYPYDDGSVSCTECNTAFHRVCWTRKNMICPKCVRIENRRSQLEHGIEDVNNGNCQ